MAQNYYPSILRCSSKTWKSINILTSAAKKEHLLLRTPLSGWFLQGNTCVLESLFNWDYCEIFNSTYFEKHLQAAASENVFIKLRKAKKLFVKSFNLKRNRFFQHQYQKQVKMFAFISLLVSYEVCIQARN